MSKTKVASFFRDTVYVLYSVHLQILL